MLGTAALVTVAPATVASAAATDFDIYNLASPGLRIVTGSCRYIPVTARTTAPDYVADVDATVDLWRGGSYKDNVTLHRDTMDPQLLVGRYYFCPGIDEPGTYRLGETEVSWNDADYTLDGTFIDETTSSMVAKQATRAYLSGTKSGSLRTIKARAQYFGAGFDSQWYHYPKGTRVNLQRRAANGTGTWRFVTSRRTDARGAVVFQVRAGKAFAYRVVAAGTARSWALASGSIVR
jgi:hypothetical protein